VSISGYELQLCVIDKTTTLFELLVEENIPTIKMNPSKA
jgi:hypothetical protein